MLPVMTSRALRPIVSSSLTNVTVEVVRSCAVKNAVEAGVAEGAAGLPMVTGGFGARRQVRLDGLCDLPADPVGGRRRSGRCRTRFRRQGSPRWGRPCGRTRPRSARGGMLGGLMSQTLTSLRAAFSAVVSSSVRGVAVSCTRR